MMKGRLTRVVKIEDVIADLESVSNMPGEEMTRNDNDIFIRNTAESAAELLKAQRSGWISAKERLPEIKEGHEYYGTICIVCNNIKQVFMLRYCKHIVRNKEVYRWMRDDMSIYNGEVVCWQPLPEPPKDGE